ncbi:MAG TPA: hypothetical protein VMT03_15705 [Polyangia bacterium]|nr:hypothetical protein [Polyangia bacterium]
MAFLKRRFWAGALLLGSLLTSSCFSPNQPVCAFSCAEAGVCPDGYTCGTDKFCHKNGATGICTLDDAGTTDAMSNPD